MRFIFVVIALALSSASFANTYNNCSVEDISSYDQLPNLILVTVICTAPDATVSGPNCISGTVNPRAFVFDSSTASDKAELALVLTAMTTGNHIFATTYGACLPNTPDTALLYMLKAFKQ